MRFPRRIPRVPIRQALAVAALFAQLVAATGAPLLAPRASAKGGTIPFPCQNHACGCATPEQGWAGDCCCFTLEEKLAWAEARGIEPPTHVRAAVEARKARTKAKPCCAKPSCCETAAEADQAPGASETPSVRWIAGVLAQKCRGDGPNGLLKVDVGTPPCTAAEVRESLPACGRVTAPDPRPSSISPRPPIPPPRVS